jgi:hypothetical protein
MSDASELTGRALDVAVAAKLFGFAKGRWASGAQPKAGWFPPDWFADGSVVAAEPGLELYRNADRHVPHYSRDWAGAGLVVDEMRRRGWYVECRDEPSSGGAEARLWLVEFAHDDPHRSGYCWHAEFPVAVCRAALAAMEAAT